MQWYELWNNIVAAISIFTGQDSQILGKTHFVCRKEESAIVEEDEVVTEEDFKWWLN